MKFYRQNTVQKTKDLRRKGMSFKQIAKRFRASEHTIRRWCADIPSNHPYHIRSLLIKKVFKENGEKTISNFDISPQIAKILASTIYWCEGYRFPLCTCVGFSNSDINLVKTFLELFRMGFKPDERKFRAHLQLHTTHDIKKMISFWSKLLKIPQNQFYKPTITPPTKRMKRTNYKGTCTIKYFDYSILHEMMGIYEGLIQKILKT